MPVLVSDSPQSHDSPGWSPRDEDLCRMASSVGHRPPSSCSRPGYVLL